MSLTTTPQPAELSALGSLMEHTTSNREDLNMTVTETALTITCPAWCDVPDCEGEHGLGAGEGYVPATGGLPHVSAFNGATFPVVGVALTWDTIDHLDPSVSLHISGEHVDSQADLRPHEARLLIERLTEALRRLEEGS